MRLPVSLAVAAALVLGANPGSAQTASESYVGRVVTGVQVLVDGEVPAEPVFAELVETRAGDRLSLAAVRESIAHLFSIGRFQDIQVEAVPSADGGVALRYTLIPVHAVARVEFRGDLGLSERLLRSTVTERFGRAPQPGRAADVVRTLERLYEDHGYVRPSVRAVSTDLRGPARTALTFEIVSGPRARVGTVEVVGDPRTSQDDLLRRLRLAPGQPYERVTVQQRLAAYVQRLRGRGHLQAIASHQARLSADGQRADLVVDVQAGPIVSVSFEGDPLPADRREALVPFQREASVDEDLLEDAVQRIREYLRSLGHWKAEVSVEPIEAGDRLTITFHVRRGPEYRVAPEGVEVTGNVAVSIEDIRPLLVLAPGDLYVASRLDASVGALQRFYRTAGHAWVEVRSAENEIDGGGPGTALVRPAIVINEGPRATIGSVTIRGTEALTEAEVRRVMRLQPGAAYYEPLVAADRDAVQLEYLDLGFATADVRVAADVSEDRSTVDLTFLITEGPQTFVDHVIIVGNQRTSENVIRREVLLRPGAPLGLRDLLESRRRLSALGLFRRIDIRELEHGPPTRRDVLIAVEESPPTTVGYGGGLEWNRRLRAGGPGGAAEERIELAPRGFFDIGRRNLGGKNRSVNLFTRVSLRPRDAPDDPLQDGSGFGFSEYRIVGTYREPAALLWNADFTLTGAVEQGVRSSFNFARKGVTAETVRRLTPLIRTSVRYSFSTTRTFDERLSDEEQAAIDRLFPQVRLSAFSGAVVRDTRDDVAEPTRGTLLSAEGSVAARALGGQVGFMKTYLQGYWFTQVPGTRGIIVATRASVGLADGFEREAVPGDPDGGTVEDLPASERFFAGGDTTIRGFALDTVGTPQTISPRGFPRGGNAVLIMNGELRIPVWSGLGTALFVDGGNVFERVTDFTPGELRGSLGFGIRYRSPIGPVRLDLGFKMDRREFGGRLEPRRVLHFSIGQAF
jgi:outer membrane protein insertion porin family